MNFIYNFFIALCLITFGMALMAFFIPNSTYCFVFGVFSLCSLVAAWTTKLQIDYEEEENDEDDE